jgi:hypothetical protein
MRLRATEEQRMDDSQRRDASHSSGQVSCLSSEGHAIEDTEA